MRPSFSPLFALVFLLPLSCAAAERTPVVPADALALSDVYSPVFSPEGDWVAYLATESDVEEDTQDSDLWMASWDGARNVRLTRGEGSESTPRWSPDGRYLAFLASRPGKGDDEDADDEITQVWLLDRAGGEPEALTAFPGDVQDFAWSPDGKRLAVVARDPDSRKTADEDDTPPPIVIDRYYFKEDYSGYLGPEQRRLYLFDVATRTAERLTVAAGDQSRPSWSPDGRTIAYYGREGADPDRHARYTLFLADAKPGATPRRLTDFQGENGDSAWMSEPRWSPDGRRIVFTGGGDPALIYYATYRAFVIDVAGGEARPLAASLDRNMMEPRWSPDGRSVLLLLEDDRNQQLVRVSLAGDRVEPLTQGRREITGFDARGGRIALLESTVDRPPEVVALEGRQRRALSRRNDAWLAQRALGAVEETAFTSRDGTAVHGFIVKPPGYRPGQKYPAILDIHGGPVSQFANAFLLRWQVLAGAGYVVIGANPRGSSGRGQDYARAIWADWGNKDSEDVLAAVEHAVAQGVADPERLGVGGWSYGGILTNQVIARDGRFKAAVSGASLSNALAGYGTDMYIREYELELGHPWENPEAYLRVSYPFLNAHRIRTPTLFLCGDRDFNVPLLNSEQMYQALKSRGVDTRLVIYPDQYHGIDIPSYQKDRLERYLDWYGRYLR